MPEQQSSSGYGICCLFGSVAPGFPLRSSSIVTDLYYIDVFLSKNTGGGGSRADLFHLSSLISLSLLCTDDIMCRPITFREKRHSTSESIGTQQQPYIQHQATTGSLISLSSLLSIYLLAADQGSNASSSQQTTGLFVVCRGWGHTKQAVIIRLGGALHENNCVQVFWDFFHSFADSVCKTYVRLGAAV